MIMPTPPKQERRLSPLMSYMGELLGHQQQERTMHELVPAFALVVDNARIHPKHTWASQLHRVPRISSCPNMNTLLVGAATTFSGGMGITRGSSTGSLCRWGCSSSFNSTGGDSSSVVLKTDGAARKPQRRIMEDESLSTTACSLSGESDDDDFGDFVIFVDDADDGAMGGSTGRLRPPPSIEWSS